MDIKELNKAQLIMLIILLSFVVSIASSIITVSLVQTAPSSISLPINRVIRETVEKIVPATNGNQALSEEQKKLLEELKAIKPLTVTLFLKGEKEDTILGTGLFLGENKVVIASLIPAPKESENYVIKSVLGEQKVSKVTQEKDFSIIEFIENTPTAPDLTNKDLMIDTSTTSPAVQ